MERSLGALVPVEPLEALPDAIVGEWRERMDAADYRPAVIGSAESVLRVPFDAVRLPLVHWMLERRTDPGAVLARLWAYDGAPERGAIESILGARVLGALTAAGVLDLATDGRIRSRFRLMPFEDLWLLSDPPDAGGDTVMGPGGTTGEVRRLLPRSVHGDLLDMGCGAGSLALLCARRGARSVTGADVNPRAVSIARFNARLNAITAEFVQGDLFGPLSGRTFDWIVAQPPYVLEPPGTPYVAYLHGGERGEAVSARLLPALSGHLAPGGIGLVLMDVALGTGEPVHERLRRTIGTDGTDLCAIVAAGLPPDMQAAGYAMIEDPSLGDGYAEAARRYRAHFDRLGIREFRHVAVVVRRTGREAAGFTATLPVHGLPRSHGRSVADVLEALDLALFDDAELLTRRVRPSPWASYTVERTRPAFEDASEYRVRFDTCGIGVDQELSDASLALLELLETAPAVADAIDGYAERCGDGPDAHRAAVLEFVRRGLGTGLIVPGGSAEP